MATNFNPLLNLFRIEQTQGTAQTQSAGKIGSENNKPNSIFNAAGVNAFAEDSVDSFTRTTKNEQTQTDNKTTNTKATSPIGNAKKGDAISFGAGDKNQTNKTESNRGFGSLSGQNNVDNKENDNKNGKTGFGSLSFGGGTQYTVNNDNEIKELAEELGCEATEDAVKKELQGMSAQDLVKLDGNLLDMAEDLDLISMKDVEEKTGVNEKDLASKNKDKDGARKIKFGTMTSGDMV